MARYYLERYEAAGWAKVPTRPLTSAADARRFIANLRHAPIGGWADADLRLMRNGGVFEGFNASGNDTERS